MTAPLQSAAVQPDGHVRAYGSTGHDRPVDRWLGLIDNRLTRLNAAVALAGVILILLTALFQTVDVLVFRALLNAPVPGGNEVFKTVFPVAIAAVLAAGLSERATLEVDVLAGALGPAGVRFCRAVGAMLYLAAIAAIFIGLLRQSEATNARNIETVINQIRVGPFQTAIVALFAMCLPAQLLTALRLAVETHRNWVVGLLRVAIVTAAIMAGLVWVAMTMGDWFISHIVGGVIAVIGLLWLMIMLFVPVASAMVLTAMLGISLMFGSAGATGTVGLETMNLLSSLDMAVVPFFLLMGGFAIRSGMANDIYELASAVFAPLRGGLAMGTIGGCAGFGALTGSSVATVVTIGKVAFPEMQARGYSPALSTGVIAAGGTLGQLIPPSTVIVLYALLTELSIGTLYVAIIVPGLLTMLFYLVAVMLYAHLAPAAVPGRDTWSRERIRQATLRAFPAIAMFTLIFGGIFSGIFTANEAAGIGAIFAAAVMVLRRRFSRLDIPGVVSEATGSTSMMYMLIIGGFVTTFFFSATGLPDMAAGWVAGLPLPGWMIIALMCALFALLGTTMDSIAIMMVTAGVTASIVTGLGYDPVWWGVVMVVIVELGLITPPFGLNLFALKAVSRDLRLGDMYRGVLPFVAADIVKLALLIIFPQLAMWLPSLM